MSRRRHQAVTESVAAVTDTVAAGQARNSPRVPPCAAPLPGMITATPPYAARVIRSPDRGLGAARSYRSRQPHSVPVTVCFFTRKGVFVTSTGVTRMIILAS